MKVFAFAGSTSSASINKKLVHYALQHFKSEDVHFIDLNDYAMPVFCVDLEKDGFPSEAHAFLKNIENCDVILCSLAEHNRSYAAAFKNVFDWCSRINVKVFQDKPMFLMTTSPGGYGGGNVMAEASKFFPQFGADIRGSFSLPKFYENFDEENGIINPELKQEVDSKIIEFKKTLHDGAA